MDFKNRSINRTPKLQRKSPKSSNEIKCTRICPSSYVLPLFKSKKWFDNVLFPYAIHSQCRTIITPKRNSKIAKLQVVSSFCLRKWLSFCYQILQFRQSILCKSTKIAKSSIIVTWERKQIITSPTVHHHCHIEIGMGRLAFASFYVNVSITNHHIYHAFPQ